MLWMLFESMVLPYRNRLLSFEMVMKGLSMSPRGRKKESYLMARSTPPPHRNAPCQKKAVIKALLLVLPYPQQLLCILSINMANAAAKKAAAGKCGL
jgi:hypothetical protein